MPVHRHICAFILYIALSSSYCLFAFSSAVYLMDVCKYKYVYDEINLPKGQLIVKLVLTKKVNTTYESINIAIHPLIPLRIHIHNKIKHLKI